MKLKGKWGLYCWENGFYVFPKTDSLQECSSLWGKRKNDSKISNFDQPQTRQEMSLDVLNQFPVSSVHVRRYFEHYFGDLGGKVKIDHLGLRHSEGFSTLEPSENLGSRWSISTFPPRSPKYCSKNLLTCTELIGN